MTTPSPNPDDVTTRLREESSAETEAFLLVLANSEATLETKAAALAAYIVGSTARPTSELKP